MSPIRDRSVGVVLYALTSPRALRMLAVVGLGSLALLAALDAEARVGGGQGFSSGRSSSSGGSGGGDSDLLIDIFILLLHLCIEYPAIGVPLLLVFLAAVAIRVLFFSGDRSHYEHRDIGLGAALEERRYGRASENDLATLVEADPAFSEPVFLDFAGLVHRRALAAASSRSFEPLLPFVDEAVLEELSKRFGYRGVGDVVVGSTRITGVSAGFEEQRLEVVFETNYALGEPTEQVFVDSRWVFRRDAGAISLEPESTLAMGCPSCGNPVETTALGACTTCGTAITRGQLQWQVVEVVVREVRPVQPPALHRFGGGDEPSVRLTTVMQDGLGARLRRFKGRHPEFDSETFKDRVKGVYLAVQDAWSANRWNDARPFVTDPLFQQLRFWIDGYVRHGLRNHLEDVTLHRVQIVKVQDDAWYESITVRIWGSMKDSTQNAAGEVVAGNAEIARNFSEYWTFLRASGTGADSKPSTSCPSCGAPLDRIGSTGVCGYCDSKITTGRFDWVLSRIDQCDGYRG
ncbi:MAG: TIM44-like domain-containing protein [Myxococcota bacterium]